MGTRLEEREYGNDCAYCWASGETPEFIYVMFEGVKVGDLVGSKQLPLGHLFKCVQSDADPCLFEYGNHVEGWYVSVYRSGVTGNWLVIASFAGVGSHFDGFIEVCPVEHIIFDNVYWSPIWWHGWGGIAAILWTEAALSLVEAMNIPDGDTFMEFFLKDKSEPVYKFCNRKYGINKTILYIPE